MNLNAYTKVIIFEDEMKNEIMIKQGVTNLKIITAYGEEYSGNVIGLYDDRLTLKNDKITKDILFVVIKKFFLL